MLSQIKIDMGHRIKFKLNSINLLTLLSNYLLTNNLIVKIDKYINKLIFYINMPLGVIKVIEDIRAKGYV